MNKINYFGVDAYLCDETKLYGGSFYSDLRIYEPEKVAWMAGQLKTHSEPVLLDIGASTGSYSLLPLIVPDLIVWSFEPCAESFLALVNNLDINKLPIHRAQGYPLSGTVGWEYFHTMVSDTAKALSMLGGNPAGHKVVKSRHVFVYTIDSFLEGQEEIPTAIKIDTEGNELNVLKGGFETIKKYHPVIQCEYSQENANQYGYNVELISEFLKQFDYNIEIKDADLFAV